MATDEKYAAEKMQGVEGAVKMCRRICEENGYVSAFDAMKAGNGTVNKIGIVTDDNGNMKFFAELEKSSDKQKERIEKYSVKRTTVEAGSIEELIEKIKNIDWNNVSDSKSGDRFDFSVQAKGENIMAINILGLNATEATLVKNSSPIHSYRLGNWFVRHMMLQEDY